MRMKESLVCLFLVFFLTDLALVQGAQQLRVVCYMAGWARYRKEPVRFDPEDIDTSLCTHIIFAFADMDNQGTHIIPASSDDPVLYRRLTSLKREAPTMKVMLSLGGTNAESPIFSNLVKSESNMRSFATSAVQFLRQYNFDGLDVAWEYPGTPPSPPEDKHRFTQLLQILQKTLSDNNLILSAAISPVPEIAKTSYELPDIAKYVDFLNVMTYDLHGSWEDQTGHHSALYSPTNEQDSVDFYMQWMVNSSVPAEKMNMGIPFYGNSYNLQDSSHTDVGSSSNGAGAPGELTNMDGALAYYEICKLLTESAGNITSGTLANGNAPFIVDGNRWTGYDDATSVKEKVDYAIQHGLGGVSIWTIDMDDFHGICGQGHYPLLHVIHNAIGAPIGR